MVSRYRPVWFFALAFLLSWSAWFGAAWFSRQPDGLAANIVLQLAGLLGPFASALVLLSLDRALWDDFKRRLMLAPRAPFLPVTLLVMPAAAAIAVWISGAWTQLRLVPDLAGMVPIMVLAPAFEELGWRGYGVDALRSRLSVRGAAAVFALLWALWHAPLFLIVGNYQSGLLGEPLHVANFFASVVPAAIIANWLYEKHRRSIPAAILFHFMLDAVAESFALSQDTKCIVTAVFLAIAASILLADRKAFAAGPRTFAAS
jgi:membrane protease YdiL (CAAX protease family)